MGERDDDGLGLSLSLRCPEKQLQLQQEEAPPFALNLMQPSLSLMHHHNRPRPAFQPPPDLRGIDVNRPAEVECEEETAVSSPNSTVSSVSGKRSENDAAERGISDEDDGGDAAARKKLRLSKDQAAVLEETFKEHNNLNPKEKSALAKQLNLRPRQVEVWFQNRRARTKLKQTEVDCEYLKRSCENLTEENRRLQKEVNELRALKLSPQFYMNMNPPTTLTMCPQCERVAASSSSSAAAASLALAAAGGANSRLRNLPHQPRPTMPIPAWVTDIPRQPLDVHYPKS